MCADPACRRSFLRRVWRAVLVLVGLTALGQFAAAYEVAGVQPYALDQPRLPAMLSVPGGGVLSYESALTGERIYAFDWFLDTAASRILLSRSTRDALGVRASGGTVQDWGISGTETFDVSIPYVLHAGDSGAASTDPRQFPFHLACVLELRRNDQNALNALPESLSSALGETAQAAGISRSELGDMLTPAIDIVGTPFLLEHTVVLDPRPVAGAMSLVGGMLQGVGGRAAAGDPASALDQLLDGLTTVGDSSLGQIRADVIEPGQAIAAPQIVVPLVMRWTVEEPVPVSEAPVPFIAGVVLENVGRKATADLVLDTGGAVSLISTSIARQLGLDLAHPAMEAPMMGVGQGAASLKGFWLTRAIVPTVAGGPVVYERVPFFVADVAGVDGTIGANMLIPSVYVDLDMGAIERNPMSVLAGLRQGVTPFSRIVLDLPHARLGLDPMPAPPAQPGSTARDTAPGR